MPTKDCLDKIPRLYETEAIDPKDKLIYLHFFIIDSDWYIAEYDGEDIFFGFAILHRDYDMAEWGYMSFGEFQEIKVLSIEVDSDLYWDPVPAGSIEYIKRCLNRGW